MDVGQNTQSGWELVAGGVITMKVSSATLYYLAMVMMPNPRGIADGQGVDERFGAGYDATILLKIRAEAS